MGFPVRDRGFGGPSPYAVTPGVKWLLIINVGIFVLSFLFAGAGLSRLLQPLGLVPFQLIFSLAIWQPFTYMFLHSTGGFMHILMNMLTLWMFGSALEQVWGTRRFLKYYFYCGLGAAACIVAFNLALGMGNTRTIGASGAVYGLLLAFGVLFPRVTVLFMFLFPIQARWMVIIIGTMVFLSTITEAGGPISNIGHLGGMLTGYLLLRGGVLDRASKKRGPSFNPIQEFDRWWREWRLRRARRKFQVYMREQERDRNHRVQ